MKSLKVLLVDNHAGFLAAAQRFLLADPRIELSGQASSGREALSQLSLSQPDLVLVEWNLPGMDGLETIRRIKALPEVPAGVRHPAADTPSAPGGTAAAPNTGSIAPAVIIMTLHDGPAYRAAAAAAGADGFVCKAEFCGQLTPLLAQLFGLAWRDPNV